MKKEVWIEKLRVFAAIAVVLIHVVQGTYGNGMSGIPLYRSIFDVSILMSCSGWAVPVFIMITGYLLLNPQKDLPVEKVKKYIGRILLVLATLGLFFCLIESFITCRSNGMGYVIKDAVIHLVTGRSWAHMWYLYMLVGLYVLTPVLRAFVKEASGKTFDFVMLCLFLLTIACPTINKAFGISITNFYLSSFPYVFYYLFGYYVTTLRFPKKYGYAAGALSFAVCVVASAVQPEVKHAVHDYNNVFLALLSMSIFFVAYQNRKKTDGNETAGKVIRYISDASFCIYLLHPVFLNILNKGLGLYVTQFPVILGELLFFAIAFSLSLLGYEITKRIFH